MDFSFGASSGGGGFSFASFACPYCQQQGHSESSLYNHVFEQHQDDRTHVVCPMCAAKPGGRSDYYSRDFHGHLQARHPNNRGEPAFNPYKFVEPGSLAGSGPLGSSGHLYGSGGRKKVHPYSIGIEPVSGLGDLGSSRSSKIAASVLGSSDNARGSDGGVDRSDQWRAKLSEESLGSSFSSSSSSGLTLSGALALHGNLTLSGITSLVAASSSSNSPLSSSQNSSPSSSSSIALDGVKDTENNSNNNKDNKNGEEYGRERQDDETKQFVSQLLFSSLFTNTSDLPDFDLSSDPSSSIRASEALSSDSSSSSSSVDIFKSLNPFSL